MKKTLRAAAALVLTLGTTIGSVLFLSAPAQAACADGACTVVNHITDSGYDADIIVQCADGRSVAIPEGYRSNASGGCADVKAVYIRTVRPGIPKDEVHCKNGSGTWVRFANAGGWYPVTWSGSRDCVEQLRSDNA